MDVVHLFQDASGEWRWHRKSENGKIVSESGEGYLGRDHNEQMARELNGPDVDYVYDEDHE